MGDSWFHRPRGRGRPARRAGRAGHQRGPDLGGDPEDFGAAEAAGNGRELRVERGLVAEVEGAGGGRGHRGKVASILGLGNLRVPSCTGGLSPPYSTAAVAGKPRWVSRRAK